MPTRPPEAGMHAVRFDDGEEHEVRVAACLGIMGLLWEPESGPVVVREKAATAAMLSAPSAKATGSVAKNTGRAWRTPRGSRGSSVPS